MTKIKLIKNDIIQINIILTIIYYNQQVSEN